MFQDFFSLTRNSPRAPHGQKRVIICFSRLIDHFERIDLLIKFERPSIVMIFALNSYHSSVVVTQNRYAPLFAAQSKHDHSYATTMLFVHIVLRINASCNREGSVIVKVIV